MERISNEGSLSYRTRLMSIESAGRFAKCLNANQAFCGVTIETSKRAKSDARYFVQFQPSNPERLEDMAGRQQAAREERATTREFLFWQDPEQEGTPVWSCFSFNSGNTYTVSPSGCDCKDHEMRCRWNGLQCIHQIGLRREQFK